MANREEIIKAQQNAAELLKFYSGKSHELYKLSIKDIRETLKKYLSVEEKINFLKEVLSSVINHKIEINQEIDETYSPEEQINSIYPIQLSVQELEKEVKALLIDYQEISKLTPLPQTNDIVKENGLSHKQQVLFLFQIGFFDLPQIKNLSIQDKGKIVSTITNKDEKNSSDYIRYFNGKNIEPKFNCKTPKNIEAVNLILKELGLSEIA